MDSIFNPMAIYRADNAMICVVHLCITVAGIWLGIKRRYLLGSKGLHHAFIIFWISGALYHGVRVFVPDHGGNIMIWMVTLRALFALPVLIYLPEMARAAIHLPTIVEYERLLKEGAKLREEARKQTEIERDKRKTMERVLRRWKREVDGMTDSIRTHEQEGALVTRAVALSSELTVIAEQMKQQETPLPPTRG